MKVSLILKIVGTLHVAVGGMLIYLLMFAHEMLMESMGADVSLYLSIHSVNPTKPIK